MKTVVSRRMTTLCSALLYYYAEIVLLFGATLVISQSFSNDLIQQDKCMEHQVFRKLECLSLYECAAECLTSSVCLSFGFEHKTETCFLQSNTSDYVSISPRSGFYFSDIQRWPKALSGPCSVMSCPATTSCQVDRHGRATCVPEFTGCSHPPDVPGASKTYDGHYQGAVVTYTCKEDYTACHQRNTSVCQASGQWETVAGICGKSRWRNPRIKSRFDLTCGPQSNFSILVLATPKKGRRPRFSVPVRKTGNTTFLSDFRFNYRGKGNNIVLNSRFGRRWGKEVIRPLPLTVIIGKESVIRISLYGGEYKLVVDDVFMVNFPERESGIQPDHVVVYRDVFVRLVEISI